MRFSIVTRIIFYTERHTVYGMQTVFFKNKPRIMATGTIAGPKECAGVVGKYVDKALADDTFGESTYEKAESKMLSYAISRAIENAKLTEKDIDLLIAGDLLNQIISASFAARDFTFPFLGYIARVLLCPNRLRLRARSLMRGIINALSLQREVISRPRNGSIDILWSSVVQDLPKHNGR